MLVRRDAKAILVHGGAGRVTAERAGRLRAGVRAAADAGNAVLAADGSALDAVVAAVQVLEDDPEFNAGTGAALTRDGTVETDASVMDGELRRVGAVAAVPDLANPVVLARAVLEAGEHVLLAGPAAWRFAHERGICPAPPGTLITERARLRLEEARAGQVGRGVIAAGALDGASQAGRAERMAPVGLREREGGTVGAVARDRRGRLAAATSTGGIVHKRAGRIGDSPIPGAGTWADREIAISATGDGEAILRVALARTIAAYTATGMTVREAAIAALGELRRITGGSAGVIAVDHAEHVFVQLSDTMPVAWIDDTGAGDSMGFML
ncbi:MAG TPA: isoaspartyl peptidase/L-asparaginase [Kofleriaceae bacterium]|nr:isoaspartyl peptidase/L-asparaginase [Kofleriaceae bacterium]